MAHCLLGSDFKRRAAFALPLRFCSLGVRKGRSGSKQETEGGWEMQKGNREMKDAAMFRARSVWNMPSSLHLLGISLGQPLLAPSGPGGRRKCSFCTEKMLSGHEKAHSGGKVCLLFEAFISCFQSVIKSYIVLHYRYCWLGKLLQPPPAPQLLPVRGNIILEMSS